MRYPFGILSLILCACLCAPGYAAQQPATKLAVKISDVRVEQQGQQVTVGLTAEPARKAVKSNYKLSLTPYLWSGADTLRLDPMVVIGKNKQRRQTQQRWLAGIKTPAPEQPLKQGVGTRYQSQTALREWMYGSSLGLERKLEGCCTEQPLDPQPLASNLLPKPEVAVQAEPEAKFVPQYTPRIPVAQVSEVHKKWQFKEDELIIDFRVARTEIDPTLFVNQKTLDLITDAVKQIRSNPLTRMNEIDITGYASPEGDLQQNIRLAEARAQALKGYLQQHIDSLPDSIFQLHNGGENWDGLRRMVASSDMKYRDQVLAFIDNTPLVDPATKQTRNNRLKKLLDGEPYRHILKYFYPNLRSACYISIYYDVVGDTAADKINRAIEHIAIKEYDTALSLLMKVCDDPRAWNSIGVCYLMTDRPIQAKAWLEQAAENGDAQAAENLKQLE